MIIYQAQFAISYKLDKTMGVYGSGQVWRWSDSILRGEADRSFKQRPAEHECLPLITDCSLHNLNFSLGFNATYSNISYSYSHYRGFPMLIAILRRIAYET